MFGIVLYYMVIISWCLNYFFLSFSLGWGDDPDSYFFKTFLEVSSGPSEIGDVKFPILAGLVVIWFINWAILYRGVQRGVELANKIFMPLLFALTAILVLWSLTLDGAMTGIKAYLTPDFSKISKPQVWIDAYSQIFFTLSLGFGIMIAYASYLPSKTNITKNALLTAFINSGFSIFAGFAVFSVLGFMAVSQGKDISEVVSQSIGLAFVAYPKAVSLMPGGNLFGAIFFLCLVVAGISSSISIIEAFTAAMVDKFAVRREIFITVICLIGFLGSIMFTTQAGLFWLDIVDHFLTHYGLIVVGIAECVLVGWFFKLNVVREHLNKISSIKLGLWWDILIKYFVPLVLVITLIWDLSKELKEPYGGYSWASLISIGVDWILLTLIAAFAIASRPWKTGHRETGGRSGG